MGELQEFGLLAKIRFADAKIELGLTAFVNFAFEGGMRGHPLPEIRQLQSLRQDLDRNDGGGERGSRRNGVNRAGSQ